MHMVTHGSRDTDADAEAHGKVRRLIAVVDRNLLLNLHSATHCAVDAIKDDQERITAGPHDPAAVLLDGWINHLTTQMAEPLEGSCIIQADQPLAPILLRSGRV